MTEECDCVDWFEIVEELEAQKALIEPLENFCADGFEMPPIREAVYESWHSTIH